MSFSARMTAISGSVLLAAIAFLVLQAAAGAGPAAARADGPVVTVSPTVVVPPHTDGAIWG